MERMGASGKKLQGHGARQKRNSPPPQAKDGGFGLPPHPVEVRIGQRYCGRGTGRHRPLQVARVDAKTGTALLRPIESEGRATTIAVERLLATRRDRQGRTYQFLGFAPRRYRTVAVVAAIRADGQAELVLPEWHPARPVLHPARLLPTDAAAAGRWLSCTADLSQGRPATLRVADLAAIADPGPERSHRPAYAPAAPVTDRERPAAGRGCGDIVLDVPEGIEGRPVVGGLLELVVVERAGGMRAGDRVYLADGSGVSAYLELRERRVIPNGDRLRCEPAVHALTQPVTSDGRCVQGRWRWRWWERGAEATG